MCIGLCTQETTFIRTKKFDYLHINLHIYIYTRKERVCVCVRVYVVLYMCAQYEGTCMSSTTSTNQPEVRFIIICYIYTYICVVVKIIYKLYPSSKTAGILVYIQHGGTNWVAIHLIVSSVYIYTCIYSFIYIY